MDSSVEVGSSGTTAPGNNPIEQAAPPRVKRPYVRRQPPPLPAAAPTPVPQSAGSTGTGITVVPADLATLGAIIEAAAQRGAARALADHTALQDTLLDAGAMAAYLYAGRSVVDGRRALRQLRATNPWIDEYSIGADKQRRWPRKAAEEIARRLGRSAA